MHAPKTRSRALQTNYRIGFLCDTSVKLESFLKEIFKTSIMFPSRVKLLSPRSVYSYLWPICYEWHWKNFQQKITELKAIFMKLFTKDQSKTIVLLQLELYPSWLFTPCLRANIQIKIIMWKEQNDYSVKVIKTLWRSKFCPTAWSFVLCIFILIQYRSGVQMLQYLVSV